MPTLPLRSLSCCALLLSAATLAAQPLPTQPPPAPDRRSDVVYVPTPQAVVDRMLEMAKVGPDDIVYDLGSGDGRIPITAAKRHGARGFGVDIDPQRIAEARRNAERAGVADRVRFVHGDLFETRLEPATVVTLYLLPAINEELRPRLQSLKSGTRIVSHNYAIGDWMPQDVAHVGTSTIYFWTVP